MVKVGLFKRCDGVPRQIDGGNREVLEKGEVRDGGEVATGTVDEQGPGSGRRVPLT